MTYSLIPQGYKTSADETKTMQKMISRLHLWFIWKQENAKARNLVPFELLTFKLDLND